MLTIEDQELRRLDHDLKVVFIHPEEISLGCFKENTHAVVLALEITILQAPSVEHLDVVLVNIAMQFI